MLFHSKSWACSIIVSNWWCYKCVLLCLLVQFCCYLPNAVCNTMKNQWIQNKFHHRSQKQKKTMTVLCNNGSQTLNGWWKCSFSTQANVAACLLIIYVCSQASWEDHCWVESFSNEAFKICHKKLLTDLFCKIQFYIVSRKTQRLITWKVDHIYS